MEPLAHQVLRVQKQVIVLLMIELLCKLSEECKRENRSNIMPH